MVLYQTEKSVFPDSYLAACVSNIHHRHTLILSNEPQSLPSRATGRSKLSPQPPRCALGRSFIGAPRSA